MVSLTRDQFFSHIKESVAKVLLEYAGNGTTEGRWLSQRDIAAITGTNWQMIHMSLKSLQEEGVIKFERHRMIINKEFLKDSG